MSDVFDDNDSCDLQYEEEQQSDNSFQIGDPVTWWVDEDKVLPSSVGNFGVIIDLYDDEDEYMAIVHHHCNLGCSGYGLGIYLVLNEMLPGWHDVVVAEKGWKDKLHPDTTTHKSIAAVPVQHLSPLSHQGLYIRC